MAPNTNRGPASTSTAVAGSGVGTGAAIELTLFVLSVGPPWLVNSDEAVPIAICWKTERAVKPVTDVGPTMLGGAFLVKIRLGMFGSSNTPPCWSGRLATGV